MQAPDLISMNRAEMLPQLAARTPLISALLHDVVTAIRELEDSLGQIPHIYHKGEWSQQIQSLLLSAR